MSEVMPGLLAIQIQIQAVCKPLIFIPDVLKTSQEEDVNTNQDLICWFKSILV